MFMTVKYQTGELSDVVKDLHDGKIPCLEVEDTSELNWVLNKLTEFSVYQVKDLPFDRNARDMIKEPDFEFRIAFTPYPSDVNTYKKEDLLFIDVYFEIIELESYAPIFGD